jgi:RNA polymerase sigma-70 factor (ECF subfamily)
MSEPEATSLLVRRLKAGDQRAAAELFASYARRLAALADQHLSRRLAARVEAEDVVQSVFRTFFRRNSRGEFQINSRDQLWRLLVTITLRKVRVTGRRHTARVRDVRAQAEGDDWLHEAVAREPSAEEAAALLDQIEHLLRGLPAVFAELLELRFQGLPDTQIARQLGVSRQAVQRMRKELERRLSDDNS